MVPASTPEAANIIERRTNAIFVRMVTLHSLESEKTGFPRRMQTGFGWSVLIRVDSMEERDGSLLACRFKEMEQKMFQSGISIGV